MMKMSKEMRDCRDCGEKYEHNPIFFGDKDMAWNIYTCDECEKKVAKQAEQIKREDAARREWEIIVPEEYRKTRIDHPDYQSQFATHRISIKWVRGGAVNDEPHLLFYGLIGESGRCKTRIVSQMVRQMIWAGEKVLWMNSWNFQWACQNQFNDAEKGKAGKWLKEYRQAPVLVLDDIGSLKSSEVVADNLYALLEHRTTNGFPMIWTSNETPDEMLAGLKDKPRKRIISRLVGFSNMIQL